MNELKHLAEFQRILADYQIAHNAQAILEKLKLVLLVGVTATGRDTIIQELLKTGDYYHIASDTTREPRINNGVLEQNGIEYWFRSEEELLNDLKAGKLIEAEIIHNQQVSGISMRELSKAHDLDKIAITNVDLNADAIVKAKPDTKVFMVLPPSFEEWMHRLEGRGSMPEDEKRRRLETANKVFAAGLEHDYFIFVVNDELDKAVSKIRELAEITNLDPAQQNQGRELVQALYKETQLYLGKR